MWCSTIALSPGIHAPAGDGGRRSRGVANADVGTTLKDPNIDYAAAAKAFGVHGEGPISDPKELAPALKRAIAMVKSGQPALVDVVTEPR
jgi:acetolactate synthase I/II/III large subunit